MALRQPQTEQEIERLANALGDPTRRRVFFVVRQAAEAQTKDNVAEAVGIERRLAGFHLDKLVEQGFLTAEFRRRESGGPGAGRPPKVYTLAETEAAVTLPGAALRPAGRTAVAGHERAGVVAAGSTRVGRV